jgi:hypothetical protein
MLAKLDPGNRDLLDAEGLCDLLLGERGLIQQPADNADLHISELAAANVTASVDSVLRIAEVIPDIEMIRVDAVPNVAGVADQRASRDRLYEKLVGRDVRLFLPLSIPKAAVAVWSWSGGEKDAVASDNHLLREPFLRIFCWP